TFNVTLSALRKALNDSAKNPHYILTTSDGYCFIANLREVQNELPNTEIIASYDDRHLQKDRLELPFGGHITYVLISSALYASYYAVSLIVEIAYQFDRYGRTALKIALI